MLNKLLQKQVQNFFGDLKQVPENFASFLTIISDSYNHHEKDRKMLERAIGLSSGEMTELNNKLRKETEGLRKTNHELDKFVYSISHDLRAPLLSLKGIVNLTEEDTKEEITIEHMKMVQSCIERLDNFIAEVLDYSRNKRIEIKPEKIDFEELLSEVETNLLYINKTGQIKVHWKIEEKEAFYSDKNRLTIILNNFISNSLRYYNPEATDPFVKISIRTDKDLALIEIKDNGIGIKEEFHQKIFEMFYRVSDRSMGSGLGLYIVKETIGKLKGQISVESQLDKGTIFTIVVPNLFYQ